MLKKIGFGFILAMLLYIPSFSFGVKNAQAVTFESIAYNPEYFFFTKKIVKVTDGILLSDSIWTKNRFLVVSDEKGYFGFRSYYVFVRTPTRTYPEQITIGGKIFVRGTVKRVSESDVWQSEIYAQIYHWLKTSDALPKIPGKPTFLYYIDAQEIIQE